MGMMNSDGENNHSKESKATKATTPKLDNHKPLIDREKVLDSSKWIRFAYMAIYFAVLMLLFPVVSLLALLQFIFLLLKSEQNMPLKHLNLSLINFFRDALGYMTYQTEKRPFPFNLENDSKQVDSGSTQTVEARV